MKGYLATGLEHIKAAKHHEKGIERLTQCHSLYNLRRKHHSLIDLNGIRFRNMSLRFILRYTKDFHCTIIRTLGTRFMAILDY